MPDREHLMLGTGPEGQAVTLSRDELSRHTFVCGSTGSGKTSLLLSMAADAMSSGAGCMFVDGKGDRDALRGLVALAHRFGREDDLLVLDLSDPGAGRASHTFNPFATASPAAMVSMVTSLMDDESPEHAMWRGRAIAMVGPVIRALAWLRDHLGWPMSVLDLREHLDLRKVIDLSDDMKYPDLPRQIHVALKAYLNSLPGYREGKGYKQSHVAMEQHGYLQMQFTRLLGAMSDDFGHVFTPGAGDIDMAEVIAGGKVLVVLLPMGGQSSNQAAFLGNVVVSLLKDIMGNLSAGLVPRPRPGSPFMVLLDEFGQYTMPGTASVVTMARSLGISMVFSTQGLSPNRNDPGGTVLDHVLTNTATKVLMRSDNLDREAVGKLAPSGSALVDRMRDLRAGMSAMAGLASVQGRADGAADPGDVQAYRAMLAEHDGLVRERDAQDLDRLLPSLPTGDMVVSRGGRHVRATAVDMSALFDVETVWAPVCGLSLDGEALKALREGGVNVLAGWDPSKVEPVPPCMARLFPLPGARVDVVDAVRRSVAAFVVAREELGALP